MVADVRPEPSVERHASFQYNLTQSPNYESNEVSQVLASVDGMLRGTAPNDYLAQIAGNGDGGSSITTGWRTATLNLGVLGVGLHTMRIGGFNNQKNAANESTTILFDNVKVVATPAAPPAQLACDTVECCPLGTTPVVLTEQANSHNNSTANRCIVALGGSDTIFNSGSGSVVLAGSGDDTIMGGSGGQIRGGSGRDTINGFTGAVVLGGDDDDTINAANGDNFVYPGAGIDNVACGTGADTVVIYDLCETGFGERLDGGSGVNTLVTPVPLSQLQALGVIVSNFKISSSRRTLASPTARPNRICNNRGICAEGATAGQMTCLCDPGNPGPNCVPCRTELDSDEDGTPDCTDLCPYDGLKRAPGQCGCGVPDRHSDSDQVADCIDPCPFDGNNVAPGECGCVGQPGLKPAGAACTDPGCPQAGTTCNGAGVCGDRSACNPDPTPGVCRFAVREGIAYWICADGPTGGQSRDGAAQVCSAKGLTLTRIDSFEQNRFLHRQLTKPLWLGANSLSAPNVWRWAAAGSNDGDVFWSGGANGAPVDGRFSYWKPGTPGAARCALLQSSDGKWSDADCSQTIGCVCQFEQPPRKRRPGPPPGSIPQPPPAATPCVPNRRRVCRPPRKSCWIKSPWQTRGSSGCCGQPAAAHEQVLRRECRRRRDIGSSNDPGRDVSSSTRRHSPASETRMRSARAGLRLPPGQGSVGSSSPGRWVRSGRPRYLQGHAAAAFCSVPPKTRWYATKSRFAAAIRRRIRPRHDLTPRPFDAAALFSGGPPDAGQAGAYVDPASGVGRAHSWCKLNQQDPSR